MLIVVVYALFCHNRDLEIFHIAMLPVLVVNHSTNYMAQYMRFF